MDTKEITWPKLMLSNLGTLVITLVTSFFMFASNTQTAKISAEPDIYKTTIARLAHQDEKIAKLQAELLKANFKIIELTTKLSKEVDARETLLSYLDANPLAAWVKDEELKMFAVNRAYEMEFCKYRQAYIGFSDYDVWDKETASQFERHDKRVQATRGFIKFIEVVDRYDCQTGAYEGKSRLLVWKFAVTLPNGQKGVGGIIVNIEQIPDSVRTTTVQAATPSPAPPIPSPPTHLIAPLNNVREKDDE